MAKKEEMMCPTTECGPKCFLFGVIASLVAAAGLWMVVGGVMMQWSQAVWNSVLLWYTGGMVLFCVAKCIKMKACPSCAR